MLPNISYCFTFVLSCIDSLHFILLIFFYRIFDYSGNADHDDTMLNVTFRAKQFLLLPILYQFVDEKVVGKELSFKSFPDIVCELLSLRI